MCNHLNCQRIAMFPGAASSKSFPPCLCKSLAHFGSLVCLETCGSIWNINSTRNLSNNSFRSPYSHCCWTKFKLYHFMVEHRHCILITLHNNQQIQLYWFISSSLSSRVALRESNILSCLINCINFGCFLRRWNFKVGFICRDHSPQKRWERKKFYESSIIADFRRWFGKYLMAFLSSFWELSNAMNSKADRKTCKQIKTFKLEMLAERELKHETSDIDTIKIVPSKFSHVPMILCQHCIESDSSLEGLIKVNGRRHESEAQMHSDITENAITGESRW